MFTLPLSFAYHSTHIFSFQFTSCVRVICFFPLLKQIANFIYADNDHVQKRISCECVNILFSLWGGGQEMCTKHVTLILSMITSQAVLFMKIRNEKKKNVQIVNIFAYAPTKCLVIIYVYIEIHQHVDPELS